MQEIKVTQIKSTIGTIPKHQKTMKALGLRKIGTTKIHKSNPVILGMLRTINYLVKVEKV
ncbi:MAG: 50S ribosomal protein L30 [Leptospira sp.]|nr:50S ribosomal protein L30 [Leptospira sp.]